MKRMLVVVAAAALTACSSSTPSSTAGSAATPTSTDARAAAGGALITTTTSSPEALAHFQKGETLFHNMRTDEAAKAFDAALKLDPEFPLAHAFHGLSVPGPEGLKEIDAAAAAAGRLPDAERTLIEGMAAARRGEPAKAITLYTKVVELTPGDWRSHYVLGQQLLFVPKVAEAVPELKKATELNPKAGAALNMLGYAALNQGDADSAIAAFQQYAKVMPEEPNPQDSLGEALIAAGRFKEAEAAFTKALALSSAFWPAHEGIGYARAYAGDWNGARQALIQARDTATRPNDKVQAEGVLGALALAQRDVKGALAALDSAEKTAGAQPSDVAFVPLNRALVMNLTEQYRGALAPSAAALAMADGGQVAAGQARSLRRQALMARITAEAGLKDVAAATKTSAALDELAKASSDVPIAQSAMHYGLGMLAIAKGDTAGARAHFDQCVPEDVLCGWQAVATAEAAGDKPSAALTRDRLLKNYQRDPLHLIVRSRLTAPAKS
jgi:tetratricopeptide (TPR) repeat protein